MDAYLARIPLSQRKALQGLCKDIAATAVGAIEGFRYGLPAFRLAGRPLVCYRASKEHLSFIPMSPAVLRGHARELRGYGTSKGTIRFSEEHPLPSSLIRKIARALIAEMRKASP